MLCPALITAAVHSPLCSAAVISPLCSSRAGRQVRRPAAVYQHASCISPNSESFFVLGIGSRIRLTGSSCKPDLV
ncbi:hypothetical protein E2C01_086863 [Portunus trituberculatus]|uniref:Secreted protein n=1 Tax=Portunus trituberculatus TaxID=210409 RepID=A0A5B7JBP6_PORTR|nr:hypothetical protein [Portunus trituberculatus]